MLFWTQCPWLQKSLVNWPAITPVSRPSLPPCMVKQVQIYSEELGLSPFINRHTCIVRILLFFSSHLFCSRLKSLKNMPLLRNSNAAQPKSLLVFPSISVGLKSEMDEFLWVLLVDMTTVPWNKSTTSVQSIIVPEFLVKMSHNVEGWLFHLCSQTFTFEESANSNFPQDWSLKI